MTSLPGKAQLLPRIGVCSRKRRPLRRRHGFAMIEILIAVGIFAMGILALSRAMNDMISINFLRLEDGRLRQALSAYSEEVYMRPDLELQTQNIAMEGGFEGINIAQKVEPVDNLTDDEGRKISGLFLITLTASDPKSENDYTKTIRLYVRR